MQKLIIFILISFSILHKGQIITDSLNGYKFSIFLPSGFERTKNYPIIYLLDGDDFITPVINEIKALNSVDLVPPSIIVGVNYKDRIMDMRIGNDGEFTPGNIRYCDFIQKDLNKLITQKYSSNKAFRTILGHSDGAEFALKMYISDTSLWQGAILLSPAKLNLTQISDLKKFRNNVSDNRKHIFVANGLHDAASRIIGGKQIEKVFTNPPLNVKFKLNTYNTDHVGIAIRGLNDGIAFIFEEYLQKNEFDKLEINNYMNTNMTPVQIVDNEILKIKNIYNFLPLPTQQGLLSFGLAFIKTSEDIFTFYNYRRGILGDDDEDDNFYGDLFLKVGDCKNAKLFFENQLKKNPNNVTKNKLHNIYCK